MCLLAPRGRHSAAGKAISGHDRDWHAAIVAAELQHQRGLAADLMPLCLRDGL